ncbi:MAG: thioesterase family protein [Dehalococcoidia bacterium]|nr:thioesterase family protein [Dehalococcoidia bacterium]
MLVVDAIFHRDGDLFVPSPAAGSPWTKDALHGGPPAGLLARCIEAYIGDPEMQLARLTVDLFRAVPSQPLAVQVESVRSGRRIHVVQASILADGQEVTRATAALLRRSDAPVGGLSYPPPPGPDGLPVNAGLARPRGDAPEPERPRLEGFHTFIEVAWASERFAPLPTAWMRIPVPFIAGEETSPVTRAAALSDFGNALANQVGNEGAPASAMSALSYINSDITLYLDRNPRGEWLCLQADFRDEAEGVGHVEAAWFDREGRYARGVQARLANPRP